MTLTRRPASHSDARPSSLEDLARPNLFEIDLGAIAQFSRNIRKLVGSDTTIFATLKSNAYGFGLLPVARTVLAAGADAVSLVDRADAVRLRQDGIAAPILVYPGAIATADAVRADEIHDLIPSLTDLESAKTYARLATRPLKVAVKVDVGQERLGFAAESAASAIATISRMPNLKVHVVHSHPNVPSPPSLDYLDWQLGRFEAIFRELERQGISIPIRMLAGSAILAIAPRAKLTGVDPGQLFFGPQRSAGDVPWPTQRQAFRKLSSRLIHVRVLERDAFPAEAPFPLWTGMRLGVIPIGSSDGIAQVHRGEVLVRGRRARVIGTSLEHTRIDLSGIADAAIGDEVVLIGEQDGQVITPDAVVLHQRLARIGDLAMAIRSRVPRRYLEGD